MSTRQLQVGARILGGLPEVRGIGRVGSWLYRAAIPAAARGNPARAEVVTIRMRAGHTMRVPATSLQAWLAMTTRRYDDPMIAALSPLVVPGGLVLDVGACLGFMTVPLARVAAAVGARVVAVEPLPANCGYLRENVKANGLGESVVIWPVALAARVGSTSIYAEHGGVGNAALGRMDQTPPQGPAVLDGRPVARVPVATLDELAAHVPAAADRRCCLVKMDVEGFELQVLKGGQRLLGSHRPIIWGEFERAYLEDRGESIDALTRWLADSGYRSYAVWPRRRGRLTSRYGISLSPAALAGWSDAPGMLLVPAERPLATLDLPTDLVEVAER